VPRDVEVACDFIVEHVRRAAGKKWNQGRRGVALPCTPNCEPVRFFAEQRLFGVPEDAARGVLIWDAGFHVELLSEVPEPEHILGLQAGGARCVSLLDGALASGPYADPLAFALHDLRHLAKLACPEHYAEQVGFFLTLSRAMQSSAWSAFESELDETWRSDRDHVLSDMNGSSVFLFAALKMKLKMAARRWLARATNREPAPSGPLSAAEAHAFRWFEDRFLDLVALNGPARAAAIATSARRDAPESAELLAATFAEIGRPIANAARR
jgi:hypothetical protein